MNLMNLLPTILAMLAAIPAVGPILAKIVSVAAPVSAGVTALVACWHAVVVALAGLAHVPGLSKLQGAADFFKTTEDKIASFEHGWLMPILDQLSMIPLPTVVAAPAAPVAPAA